MQQKGDFKKNRGVSSNGQQINPTTANNINNCNSPAIIGGNGYQAQQFSVNPLQNKQLPGRDAIYSITSPLNDNQLVSTNSSSPSLSPKPYALNASSPSITQKERPEIDHKIVIEGVRIAIDII